MKINVLKNSLLVLFCLLNIYVSIGQNRSNTILVAKVKEAYRPFCNNTSINNIEVNKILEKNNVINFFRIFKTHSIEKTTYKNCYNCVDLSLIYQIQLKNNYNYQKCISTLLSTHLFDYVEQKEMPYLLGNLTPNDPLKANQYYVTDTSKLQMYKAWSETTGDTNIVIGVTDTGIDWAHEDIKDNVKINYLDPINGIDDDLDGYTDNYRGWDLNTNGNNANDNHGHGTVCGGISSAKTNNNKGVSGIGYNCKVLPIRVGNSTGGLTHPYEGIVYGADHGCKVINCSWGGQGVPSQFGQDIINYATFNRDVVVVAAAGNDNSELVFYPAGYKNVIAVANVNSTDTKYTGSSFGYFVTISAPGTAMYTTFKNNGYGGNASPAANGTSFAAPIVTGIAGLTRAKFPNESALSIIARLSASCDNIYNTNFQYLNKLGQGRINAFKSVTLNTAAPLLSSAILKSTPSNYFQLGDTISISFKINNYVAIANNFRVTATSLSNYLQSVNNNTWEFLTIAVDDSIKNIVTANFVIKYTTPVNELLAIKLSYYNNTNTPIGFDVLTINGNSDYFNVENKNIKTTLTSIAQIGYADPNKTKGIGFEYKGQNLLAEASFMIGNNTYTVMDNFRNNSLIDLDFTKVNLIKESKITTEFNEFITKYNDALVTLNKLNISIIDQSFFPNDNFASNNFIIKKYTIKNNNNYVLNNVYAAIVADWDVNNAYLNKTGVNNNLLLSYTYNTQSNLHAGISVLEKPANASFYSYTIDNNNNGSGGINIATAAGYSDSLKFVSMTSNRYIGGSSSLFGDDVIQVTSVGPLFLLPNDSATVSFALIADNSNLLLQQLKNEVQNIYNNNYNVSSINTKNNFYLNAYPNPFNNEVYIKEGKGNIIQIYDATGKLMLTQKMLTDILDLQNYNNGLYLLKINKSQIRVLKQ